MSDTPASVEQAARAAAEQWAEQRPTDTGGWERRQLVIVRAEAYAEGYLQGHADAASTDRDALERARWLLRECEAAMGFAAAIVELYPSEVPKRVREAADSLRYWQEQAVNNLATAGEPARIKSTKATAAEIRQAAGVTGEEPAGLEAARQALREVRAKAAFELEHPTGLHATCLSLIRKIADAALEDPSP